jgi:hypothetical protein
MVWNLRRGPRRHRRIHKMYALPESIE